MSDTFKMNSCSVRWKVSVVPPGGNDISPKFHFGNTEYYLRYFIDNRQEIRLWCRHETREANPSKPARITIHVESHTSRKILPGLTRTVLKPTLGSWIWINTIADINKEYPDFNHMEITFIVIFQAEVTNDKLIQIPKYMACFEKLSADLTKLMDQGSKPDVEFQCEDQTVKAHKNILCSRSEVLASMLQSDMKEGRTGIVKLPDENADTFTNFLRYLYTGTLPELTMELAMALYEAGDKYAVDALVTRCADFLVNNLSPENACEVLALLDAHSDKNFQDEIITFIMEKKIPLKDDLWSEFSDKHSKLANKVLIRSYKLQNTEED